MKDYCRIIGLLCVLFFPCQAQISVFFAPEIVNHLKENIQLQRGGSAVFDDCAIAVGTAALTTGRETLARNIAHASARAELAALLNGMHVKATDTLKDNTVSSESTVNQVSISQTEITTRIDKMRQSGIRVGGEWRSSDGRTLFVCLFSLVNDQASSAAPEAPLPDGIQEWNVNEAWEPFFRGAPGILKGGATLVCDDYGEQYVLAVASCPAQLPFSQRNVMLKTKAAAAALEYSKGTMLDDTRYIRESLRSSSNDEEVENDDDEIIIRHFQTRITQGNIRGLQEAGNWTIDGGRRFCGAFVVRVMDMSEESFDVPLANAESSDDILELNMEDSKSAELLRKELPKAMVTENEKEIVLELPENSPVFAQHEKEIVIVDHLLTSINVNPTVNWQKNTIVLYQPQKLLSRVRCPLPRSHFVFRKKVVVHNHLPPPRVYMPCRFYRPPHGGRMVHGRPPKPVVIRRGRHLAGPPKHVAPRACRPPRIRIRYPAPHSRKAPNPPRVPHRGRRP